MNYGKLAKSVAKSTGISENEARKYLRAVVDGIIKGLREDGNVTLINFGRFKIVNFHARKRDQVWDVLSVGFKPFKVMRYERLMDRPAPEPPSRRREKEAAAKRKAERKKKKKPPTTIIEEA